MGCLAVITAGKQQESDKRDEKKSFHGNLLRICLTLKEKNCRVHFRYVLEKAVALSILGHIGELIWKKQWWSE
jgi:hypothetical protein